MYGKIASIVASGANVVVAAEARVNQTDVNPVATVTLTFGSDATEVQVNAAVQAWLASVAAAQTAISALAVQVGAEFTV